MSWTTTRIAVTGAGGFIGGRACEYLSALGHDVRAVVHRFPSAARLSVWPMQVVSADIMDVDSLSQAFRGVDCVVHCAYGNTDDIALNERLTYEGALNVLHAASSSGVRRLVQMSTVSVYGGNLPASVSEDTPYGEPGDWYGRAKQAAEKEVLAACSRGEIEAVCLQPAIVYGPWAGVWTIEPVQRLAAGDLYLYGDGAGVCNTLYIDNLQQAIAEACTAEGVSGERFLLTDGTPSTWREFFGCYARMLGKELPKASPEMVMQRESRKARLSPVINTVKAAGKAAGKALAAVGLQDMVLAGKRSFKDRTKWMLQTSPGMMEFYMLPTVFDISRARQKLGYSPSISLEQGMCSTEEWLRFVRLIS